MYISFSCPHPFDSLVVEKSETVVQRDADFNEHTQHFICRACGASLKKSYSSCVGGVDAFMARGRAKLRREHGLD